MWKVRELTDKLTNVVMNYTDIESRVREATNDDPWGISGTLKHELSQATFSYESFPEVMGMLWKRIAENKRSPRRIYKSMLLLHHLLLHGSDRVVRAAQDRLYEIRSLQDYHVIYEPGFNLDAIIPPSGTETKDGELNVRVKAKELVELIQDEERLRDERKKARKNRDKYVGIGSDRMTTSKWDSNDYGGGNGGSGYDDDFGNKKSRSPSPTFGKSRFSDMDSDFKKSSSSNSFNNNHNSSSSFKTNKPAPPSPGLEISDDFDPRKEEKASDFGDFTSAVSAKPVPSPVKKDSTDGDFADFQSAFGDSKTITTKAEEPPNRTESKADDLLGLSLDLGGGSTALPSSNLLSDDLFSNSMPSVTNTSPASNVLDFASFGSPALSSPVGMGQFSPGFSTTTFPPMASPQQPVAQAFPQMNYGGNNILAPVLEPAKSSSGGGSVNGNIPTLNNNNSTKQSLQGTTWSDLNITMDDLNLGRSNSRNQAGAGGKTPMNQLKTNSTSNNFGGLL